MPFIDENKIIRYDRKKSEENKNGGKNNWESWETIKRE